MAKITLTDLLSSFASKAKLNNNFQQIEDELNNNVLYRDNPGSEPNQMEQFLDMNSNRVINVGSPVAGTDALRLKDITDTDKTSTAAATSVEDTSGYYDTENVEAALQEIWDDLGDTAANEGASRVAVEDTDGNFTSENVEGVLEELSNASTINTVDSGDFYVATDVEATLQEIGPHIQEVVADVATLQAASFETGIERIWLSGYYGLGTPGGGALYRDAADTTTADNGGTVFVDAEGVRWKRPAAEVIDILEWGVDPDAADNTSLYNNLISEVAEGSTIIFPPGVYTGHFLSTKAFRIEAEAAEFVNANDINPLIRMAGSETQVTTVVGTLGYGDRTINVNDASGLSTGDLIRVVDSKTRPSDGTDEINSELLRIESISMNALTVEDMVRSVQDDGVIDVYRVDAIDRPQVIGGTFSPTGTHNSQVVRLLNSTYPFAENIYSSGFNTRVVDIRNSYGAVVNNVDCIDPSAVGTGEGYGAGFVFCRNTSISNIRGRNTRHAVDLSACYVSDVRDIRDVGKTVGDVVNLAHNTFGGCVTCENVYSDGAFNYVVNWTADGVSNPVAFIARDVLVASVYMNNAMDAGSNMNAVYLQTSGANYVIRDVTLVISGAGDETTGFSSRCVRVNGLAYEAGITVDGVRSPRVNNAVGFSDTNVDPVLAPDFGPVRVANVHVGSCNRGVWYRDVKHALTGNVTANAVATTGGLVEVQDVNITNVTDSRHNFQGIIS